MICIGLNYRKHAEETKNPIPPYPVVFCRSTTRCCRTTARCRDPNSRSNSDWELELAMVIRLEMPQRRRRRSRWA